MNDLKKVYRDISRRHASALKGSEFDLTVSIREFLLKLKVCYHSVLTPNQDYKLIDSAAEEKTLKIVIKFLAYQFPVVSENGSRNFNYEVCISYTFN